MAVWESRGGDRQLAGLSLQPLPGSLETLSGASLPSSSRPGWQGHTGAKTAEITRYLNIKRPVHDVV